ncbi:MAG: GNAT family N-acetyltransferase [Dorea sp.]|nr:GNAT family N-acetyltransferase [Dorea sp.]
MVFETKEIHLKDGRRCILRSVEEKDAEAMLEYLRTVSSETPFLLRNEDEVTYTIEDEERLIRKIRKHPREIMVVAEVEGIVAGNSAISSVGGIRRVCHRCTFAIALKKIYWRLGIGSALMEYSFSLAKDMGYEQVELEVVDGNDKARRLYEHFGFKETGRNIRALKYDDGSYRDEYRMIKMLTDS